MDSKMKIRQRNIEQWAEFFGGYKSAETWFRLGKREPLFVRTGVALFRRTMPPLFLHPLNWSKWIWDCREAKRCGK